MNLTKTYFFFFLALIFLISASFCLAVSVKYEYYTTGEDAESSIKGQVQEGMTFTASSTHKIDKVKVYIDRVGSPGTSTLSIFATEGNLPTSTALTSADFNGNAIGVSPGEWKEISLSEIEVIDLTKYAIVIKAPFGDDSNKLNWWIDTDGSGSGYAGGNHIQSTDGGVSWNVVNINYDALFETWGNATSEEATTSTTTASTSSSTSEKELNDIKWILFLGLGFLVFLETFEQFSRIRN